MTNEEMVLLKRKWEYQKCKTFGNLMANFDGMKILDFRRDGVLITKDGRNEYNYTLYDKNIEITSPLNSKNAIRLRICELKEDKLVKAVSGKRGVEKDDNFRAESIELEYAPAVDA